MSNISVKVIADDVSVNVSEEIHKLHLKSLPNDVMPNFGDNLEYRYLQNILGKKGRLIVGIDGNKKIVGFLILRTLPMSMLTILNFKSVLTFLFNSIKQPLLVIRLIGQLIKSKQPPKFSAEIVYFAVDETVRGVGIGGRLISKASEVAANEGMKFLYTKTSNERLFQFYRAKKNAELHYEFNIVREKYRCVFWEI
jgi:ribosomal protein S18 acetylase RimI-like enzyme